MKYLLFYLTLVSCTSENIPHTMQITDSSSINLEKFKNEDKALWKKLKTLKKGDDMRGILNDFNSDYLQARMVSGGTYKREGYIIIEIAYETKDGRAKDGRAVISMKTDSDAKGTSIFFDFESIVTGKQKIKSQLSLIKVVFWDDQNPMIWSTPSSK